MRKDADSEMVSGYEFLSRWCRGETGGSLLGAREGMIDIERGLVAESTRGVSAGGSVDRMDRLTEAGEKGQRWMQRVELLEGREDLDERVRRSQKEDHGFPTENARSRRRRTEGARGKD